MYYIHTQTRGHYQPLLESTTARAERHRSVELLVEWVAESWCKVVW